MYTLISKLFQKSAIHFDIPFPRFCCSPLPPSNLCLSANFPAIHEKNGKEKLINKIEN